MEKSEFHLKNHSLHEYSQALNYDLWSLSHPDLVPNQSGKFFFSSIGLHILFVVVALTVSLSRYEAPKNEVIEFELTGGTADVSAAALPPPSAPEIAAEPVSPPAPVVSKNEIVVPKSQTAKAVKIAPRPKAQAVPAAPVPAKAHARPAPVKTYATPSPVVIPDNVDDIQTPSLEEEKPAPVAKFNDSDLNSDLSKIDQSQRRNMMALVKDLEKQNEEALNENNQLAAALDQESAAEAEKINDLNAARRARDAQAIAAAQSAERAAAARAAEQRAAAAAAKAAADQAAREKAEAAAASARNASGSGAGASGGRAGSPSGVRSLDQLRQQPGNPIPKYDSNERLQRQQGDVVFLAYVSAEGVPTQFKLYQTSGYRNLDAKTLAALKQWRFYPGQEGWVELPFKWDLKGGVQEMPALLRRKK